MTRVGPRRRVGAARPTTTRRRRGRGARGPACPRRAGSPAPSWCGGPTEDRPAGSARRRRAGGGTGASRRRRRPGSPARPPSTSGRCDRTPIAPGRRRPGRCRRAGVTIKAFLPDVSPKSARSGFQERNSWAVSNEPVRMTPSTPVTRRRPTSSSGVRRKARTSVGTPAAQHASATISAIRGVSGAGLKATAFPAANAARTPPAGIAIGKFHGGITATTPSGSNRSAPSAVRSGPSRSTARSPYQRGEVDALGDLGVGFGNGLGALVHHRREQLRPPARQLVGHPVEHRLAFGGRSGRPGHLPVAQPFDGPVDLLDRLDHRRLGAARLGRDGSGHERPIGGQRRVGVGFVGEAPFDRPGIGLGQPVLSAARSELDPPTTIERFAEAIGGPGELGCPRGQGAEDPQEVVGGGVLLEAAEQVADRHVEVGRGDDGGVEQEPIGLVAHDSGLGRRHALQHLELDAVGDPAFDTQQADPGHVEEVVAGDPEPDRPEVFGSQGPVEAALVVGVGVELGGVGRLLPAVDRGIDLLHGQVGPLDEADLDLTTAPPRDGHRTTQRDAAAPRARRGGRPGARCRRRDRRTRVRRATT